MSNNFGGIVESSFPSAALVPKSETGVLNFLQKYPDYDGRDVTIAIFDSGVDPRAIGLTALCDGRSVKVIERFDCTGCGDVDSSKQVTACDNGNIVGLTGRLLKLTPEMIANNTAEGGKYRVGLKTFYDLCPSKVRENITNAEKTKTWDEPHKTAIADANRKIVEFDAQNTDATKLSWDKKLTKDNLDNTLELLNNYEKIYNDVKVTYDCILYPTEKGWQTVIDTTEKGDLGAAFHIGEYSKTHEIKNIDDYLSISVNVHDEGNVLEIVGMCSSHGTHVASIASGNHATKDLDGVAPNAKIISLTIGDGRLGSMETGTALVRAMMKVMEMCREGRKIDVINMSYGEHASWSNVGRIGELMNEIVNKYGVVWVASAGNHGPALSTIGSPPDISQPSCIGVGAYVSPQMMEAEYSMREKLPANVYTWTSRDPCIDGGQGVTVCAPGGAITSVPQFTMSKSLLMNGTSMAAPHVAGAIALLISGLKQKGIDYSPYSIKRAISVTASQLSYVDPFAQGHGLLNVEKAFEHLVEYQKAAENMLRFSVRCGPNNAKGIHLRYGVLKNPIEVNVTIEPIFMNDKEAATHDKFNYNVRLNLISSQPFVQCGSFLDLCYTSRSIIVKVDPVGLPPGVHTAVVRAFDTDAVQKGPLFEIPVTVVQPHTLNRDEPPTFYPQTNNNDGSLEFQPNTIQRDFIYVPEKATYAVLHLRSTDTNRNKEMGKFFVHTNQILPKSSCRKMETMKIVNVGSEYDTATMFCVRGGHIIEMCIAKYWSNYGNTHLKYRLEFRGVEAINSGAYIMHAAHGIHKLEISSLVSEEIAPLLQLKTAAVVLKPTDSKISPLSASRDVIPDGRQIYQNILTYALHVQKAQEVALYAPIFNELLYESEFESQLWMLFDSNKAVIATGDAHSHKFYTKLEKGEYTVRLQIRHEKRDALEKIAEATMIALFKMPTSLNLDIYDHYNNCVVSGRKFTGCVVKAQPIKVLYVGPLAQEKINKANLPQHCVWLSGTLSLPKEESGRRVDAQKFIYILGPNEKKSSNDSNNGANASANNNSTVTANVQKTAKATTSSSNVANLTPSPASASSASGDGANIIATPNTNTINATPRKSKASADEYAESLRDFQCTNISKCELAKAEKIHEEVVAAHPKHLLAHLLLIQNIESTELKAQLPLTFIKSLKAANDDVNNADNAQMEDMKKKRTIFERIVSLADIVIKETEKDALLAYYGLKNDTRVDASKIKTNMDKQRNTLVEALSKKGIAVAKLNTMDDTLKDKLDELDAIYTEIIKFVDANDLKVIQFSMWHAYAHGHYGRMYKYLQKMAEEKRTRESFEELVLIVEAMDYNHLKTVVDRMTISAFPTGYRLF